MNRGEIAKIVGDCASYTFSRSSGAGGQNVNKVNTKVTARLSISALDGLRERERELLRQRLASRINSTGEIIVKVQEERSQSKNRQIAGSRLTSIVFEATREKRRRLPTRPSKAARTARLESKHRRSLTKHNRRRADPHDDG